MLIRGMRWYILNRQITANCCKTPSLGATKDSWGGNCKGWSYFLNNHLEAKREILSKYAQLVGGE
jgi:hypothetical protein